MLLCLVTSLSIHCRLASLAFPSSHNTSCPPSYVQQHPSSPKLLCTVLSTQVDRITSSTLRSCYLKYIQANPIRLNPHRSISQSFKVGGDSVRLKKLDDRSGSRTAEEIREDEKEKKRKKGTMSSPKRRIETDVSVSKSLETVGNMVY